jgi:hypothetical protein
MLQMHDPGDFNQLGRSWEAIEVRELLDGQAHSTGPIVGPAQVGKSLRGFTAVIAARLVANIQDSQTSLQNQPT